MRCLQGSQLIWSKNIILKRWINLRPNNHLAHFCPLHSYFQHHCHFKEEDNDWNINDITVGRYPWYHHSNQIDKFVVTVNQWCVIVLCRVLCHRLLVSPSMCLLMLLSPLWWSFSQALPPIFKVFSFRRWQGQAKVCERRSHPQTTAASVQMYVCLMDAECDMQ